MPFEIDDWLVHPQHGVGRVVKLERRQFGAGAARLYYEICMPKGTIWVPVNGPASGLRRLTAKGDLAQYRGLLKGRPAALAKDHRQRQIDLAERLNESNAILLRAAHEMVDEEWAAAQGLSRAEAAQEIDALLMEGRQTYKE